MRHIGNAIHPAQGDMMNSAMLIMGHQGSHKAQVRCRTGYYGKKARMQIMCKNVCPVISYGHSDAT